METHNRFAALAKILVGAYDYHPWPEAPWLALAPSDDIDEQARKLFADVEIANRHSIESAVDQWLRGESWAPLTDIQSFLLGIRIDHVACFLFELSTPDGPIQHQEQSDNTLLRWFLIDWWNRHGASRYFYNRFDE